MKPDQACYDFIKKHEGLKLHSYQDSAGIWTIGYGSILYRDGSHVRAGQTITQAQADDLLAYEVDMKTNLVNVYTHDIALNQNQYNALVSFAYNVGTAGLHGSNLLKLVRANPADSHIRSAFLAWDKAHVNGQLVVIKGLLQRRTEEADLYFS